MVEPTEDPGTESTATATAGGRPSERPPGPDGLPLLGNTLDLYRDAWGFYDEMATYGDVVSYSAGSIEFTALLHPDHIRRVLLEDHEQLGKWGFEDVGGEFASEGLLLSEGEQWRRQRELIQDAFTMDRIREYADAMGHYAAAEIESWNDGAELALDARFSRLTLRILAHSLFDLDIDGETGRVAEFTRTINERTAIDNLAAFVPMWVPIPANRRYKRRLADFRAFVEGLIDERRDAIDEHDDLLSLRLAAGDEAGGLSETEVRDQMVTFLFAGHETTSLALRYVCLALATHDDARRRLEAEYESELGGTVPTVADAAALTGTERAIKETLRLYPPAYITFRQPRRDVQIGGYLLPEGSKVTLPQYYVHRDDRWWDDPASFRPDRWIDGDDRPEYAYFPFGGGPRHCIGMRFAMLELKTVLATLLQRVDLELLSDPDPDFRLGATLRPAEPVRVRVRRRD